MIPLQILLPWVISKYTTGPKPMDLYLKAFPCRLLMGLVFALVVHITPGFMNSDGSFPLYYYGLVLFVYALHQVREKKIVYNFIFNMRGKYQTGKIHKWDLPWVGGNSRFASWASKLKSVTKPKPKALSCSEKIPYWLYLDIIWASLKLTNFALGLGLA